MRVKTKVVSTLLAICLLLTALPVTAFAGSAKVPCSAKTSGKGNVIKVKKVSYDKDDGQKELEVDFSTKVSWSKTAKVSSIKDNTGKTYKGYLTDKDNDECDIIIPSLKEGRTYTIKITGIKKRGTSGYRTLTLTVKIPASQKPSQKVKVKKVSVEDNGDIEVDFTSKVTWRNNAKITSIKDNKGSAYKGVLIDKDDDECEIRIRNMKYGRTYTIKISGVKARGAASYQTVTVTAKVPARSSKLSVKEVYYDEDYDDGVMEYKVEFKFNKHVVRKGSSYILIKDSAGKAYSSKNSYIDWDDDECELHLSRPLTDNRTYTYQIIDVKASGESSYKTLKGSFIAASQHDPVDED